MGAKWRLVEILDTQVLVVGCYYRQQQRQTYVPTQQTAAHILGLRGQGNCLMIFGRWNERRRVKPGGCGTVLRATDTLEIVIHTSSIYLYTVSEAQVCKRLCLQVGGITCKLYVRYLRFL
jgi:hypothetical protein